MINGVAHMAINVLDMDKMLDFYVDTLGMKKAFKIPKENGEPWIEYIKIAPMAFIELFHGGIKDRDLNYGHEQIGAHHWCITCTNIESLRKRLVDKGYVSADAKPAPIDGVHLNWWVHDPEGNALEINQIESDDAYQGRDEIIGIHHIGTVVSDIEKTRDFYCNKLGFKEIKTMDRDGKPWITFMEIAPGQTWEFFWGGKNTRSNTWQSYGAAHICLQCDNVAETIESLRAKGWQILIETQTGGDKNTQAWVADPDGIRIELMQIHPDSLQAKA